MDGHEAGKMVPKQADGHFWGRRVLAQDSYFVFQSTKVSDTYAQLRIQSKMTHVNVVRPDGYPLAGLPPTRNVGRCRHHKIGLRLRTSRPSVR